MAVFAILPQTAPAPLCAEPTVDDLTDLAHDLMHDEPGMQLFEATNRAAELLDDLDAYAVTWELSAQAAGNPAALQIVH
jgi:hypothetical protein